jgi:hypothetical protein
MLQQRRLREALLMADRLPHDRPLLHQTWVAI